MTEFYFVGWWTPPEFNNKLAAHIKAGWGPAGEVVRHEQYLGILLGRDSDD